MRRPLYLLSASLALWPTIASAHPALDHARDFVHGFLHPLGGFDHVLAMVAVGLLAAQLGGWALWLLPTAFISVMVLAGIAGMASVAVPFVEAGILFSVIVLGAIVTLRIDMPVAAAVTLVGFFAIFHGHAHGAEMPASASGLLYGAGFVIATAVLHALGIAIGLAVGSLVPRRRAAQSLTRRR